MRVSTLYLFLVGLGIAGCNETDDTVYKTFVPLEDIQNIPQHVSYVSHLVHHTPSAIKGGDEEKYKAFIVKPWSYPGLTIYPQDIAREFSAVLNNCYRENLQKCTKKYLDDALKENANFIAIDSLKKKGVMLANANLRQMPTDKPCFPRSNAFPFDYVQNSSLHAGTPVFISHFSKDKAWVFVQGPSSDAGFVKSSEVGILPDQIPYKVTQAKLAVVFKDNVPIYDAEGDFWAYSKVGMSLFVTKETGNGYTALLPLKDKHRGVRWGAVKVSKSIASIKSLDFTAENVEKVLQEFMSENYGWGGYLGNRDCSALIKDYLAVFRIPTYRDGDSQSKSGTQIQLGHLTPEEKQKLIIEMGIPFRTTLYRDGHIGLYVGHKDGKILMLHNVWGNKLLKGQQKGQNVIGRTIISTLEYGKELENIKADTIFLNLLHVMTIFE